MSRMSLRIVPCALLLLVAVPASAGVIVLTDPPAAPPAEPLKASPITPGFWGWPQEKAATPEAIAATCGESLAVQFADGRYFSFTFRRRPPEPAILSEAGTCSFDAAAQVERCTARLTPEDGDPYDAMLESRFATESDGTLRMTVSSEITSGPDKGSKGTVDVYPVKCPDDVAWKIILGRQ